MSAKRFYTAVGALLIAAVFFGAFIVPGLRGSILVDTQPQGCLPWHVYAPWRKDPRVALRPGDLVVFDSANFRAIDPTDAYSKLKMVAAVAGQTVAVHDGVFWVNGQYWGKFWLAPWVASKHIAVSAPWFVNGAPVNGQWTVPAGEVVLLGTEPYSFDARYWGYIPAAQIGALARVL